MHDFTKQIGHADNNLQNSQKRFQTQKSEKKWKISIFLQYINVTPLCKEGVIENGEL